MALSIPADPYTEPLRPELSRAEAWEAINGLIDRRRLLEADIRATVARGDNIHPEMHRTLAAVGRAETAIRAAIQIPDDDLRLARHQ